MPIEIKELHIKAVVSNTQNRQSEQITQADILKLKKVLVKDCVQEVMQKLKEKNER